MYKNVSSDTITVTKEEYDNLIHERDEYREIALQLRDKIRGDS